MNNSNKKKGVRVAPKKKKVVAAMAKRKPQTFIMPRADLAASAEAAAYLRLLDDPCNAPLVQPTYQGEGSGLFIRTKVFVDPVANGVDHILQFYPQYIISNSTTGSANYSSAIMFAEASTTGGTPGTIRGVPIIKSIFGALDTAGNTIGLAGSARCISACVKVHYTDTELNRKGLVGASLSPGSVMSALTAAGGAALAPISTLQSEQPQIDRLGARIHEYKWVPNSNDQEFNQLASSTYATGGVPGVPAAGLYNAGNQGGNCLTVTVKNAAAGSVTFEVVSCWEYTFNPVSAAGLVRTTVAPPRGTLNDTLRMLGNVGAWALSPHTQNKAIEYARTAGGVLASAAKVAATFGAMAL